MIPALIVESSPPSFPFPACVGCKHTGQCQQPYLDLAETIDRLSLFPGEVDSPLAQRIIEVRVSAIDRAEKDLARECLAISTGQLRVQIDRTLAKLEREGK